MNLGFEIALVCGIALMICHAWLIIFYFARLLIWILDNAISILWIVLIVSGLVGLIVELRIIFESEI